ncbi:Stk1 family PASTA domain-containing Ser/Thr kinase [Ornithinibacillus massiliensis]|uniref:non-specific serine/threonine protein kinase n=1 Tax=Ornithinibacillus massiliensis TaxID=1944633 RepID=A0ABS5MDE8_9BACI|nr:Stk1 family PASTA domain-containing Ser/Thr kinase [Ornithinibacillus massiliensis]MBS3680098.1 Stk1 family PASTA domain-containing Ser/Thr kinase [Ornithinibacillus massiliensis]
MLNGRLLSERYQIKEKIGGGGMADVYLAEDIILDRKVAIKVLRLEYANDEEFIARFDREAQSATSLSHPNVVTIYDVGEEDQILYMVMEYVDGMTLKEFIQRYGPIDVPEAIEIMKQITAAISHAHENGIVHRDIKPQNILIDTYGHIKVTDFGIAMALSATSLTQTNSVLGSVHYLSPEQARGGMATKKSDIYSLGIVFFEMLTGRLPFSGQSPVSIALKHLQSETPSVRRFSPEVPQSVENIVLKATAKDPFHRFETVYDMEDNLELALSPDRLDEPKFTPPTEIGEETKAIPIITENQLENIHHDTIVHQANAETKKVEDKEKSKGKGKSTSTAKGKTKKKRNKKKILIISILSFLLLLIVATLLFIVPGLTKPKDVTIPEDIIGQEFSEVEDELEALNLVVEREDMPHDEIEEGKVVKTNPRPGRTIKEGQTITVYVSEGKAKDMFGDYVGRQIGDVERLLEEKGYKPPQIYEVFSDEPAGVIIKQTQPDPGDEVVPEETTVIFEVSKGKEPIELDNLTGLTREEARGYLEAKGLIMEPHEEYSDTVPEGQVIRQDPRAKTELNQGDKVNVYFSIGPEILPPRSYSVTLPIEYTLEEEENNEPIQQVITIYIQDMNNPDITVANEEMSITEDTEINIDLMIEQKSQARYRVMRDNEVIYDETISYEEGE